MHPANYGSPSPSLPHWRDAPTAFLRGLLDVAVAAAQPLHCLPPALPQPPKGRTLVLGAGKAAAAMAQALEAHWPAQAPLSGLVVTRYGHIPPRPPGLPERIEVMEASHPVPDDASQQAAHRMLTLAQGLTANDLVICLISGGGSALLSLPMPGLAFADKQRIHQTLLHSGANIQEMNTVRKHLSAIKGGRLAQACAPAAIVNLVISDVPGDDPAVIASGPTVADPSTCAQALDILQRYGVEIPQEVQTALQQGVWETPDTHTLSGLSITTQLVATPRNSLLAAAQSAQFQGLCAHVLGDDLEGEAFDVGLVHASLARSVSLHGMPFQRPCVLLSGGETTVTVRPPAQGLALGRGGRAGEFCLGLLHGLQGQAGIWALAADTDGIDGMESNAGAWIAPSTLSDLNTALAQTNNEQEARATTAQTAQQQLMRARICHDAHGFFSQTGSLVETGPTHTNVNDFRVILIA